MCQLTICLCTISYATVMLLENFEAIDSCCIVHF